MFSSLTFLSICSNDTTFFIFIEQELKQPSDQRIHVLAAAFKEGYTIDHLYGLTKIDKWFLYRMKCIMDYALKLKSYRDENEVWSESEKNLHFLG